MHCLCRKYIQSLLRSCFGKFSLLCFNSCCACLLTSGFSFALVGKSRTISRITIQKCTGKFQCTGGSTVLALHFDRLLSFSILIWWVRAICTTNIWWFIFTKSKMLQSLLLLLVTHSLTHNHITPYVSNRTTMHRAASQLRSIAALLQTYIVE